MRRILASACWLAALFALVALARAEEPRAEHGAASIATSELLALGPE